jgi:hypothetical protein
MRRDQSKRKLSIKDKLRYLFLANLNVKSPPSSIFNGNENPDAVNQDYHSVNESAAAKDKKNKSKYKRKDSKCKDLQAKDSKNKK